MVMVAALVSVTPGRLSGLLAVDYRSRYFWPLRLNASTGGQAGLSVQRFPIERAYMWREEIDFTAKPYKSMYAQ